MHLVVCLSQSLRRWLFRCVFAVFFVCLVVCSFVLAGWLVAWLLGRLLACLLVCFLACLLACSLAWLLRSLGWLIAVGWNMCFSSLPSGALGCSAGLQIGSVAASCTESLRIRRCIVYSVGLVGIRLKRFKLFCKCRVFQAIQGSGFGEAVISAQAC